MNNYFCMVGFPGNLNSEKGLYQICISNIEKLDCLVDELLTAWKILGTVSQSLVIQVEINEISITNVIEVEARDSGFWVSWQDEISNNSNFEKQEENAINLVVQKLAGYVVMKKLQANRIP